MKILIESGIGEQYTKRIKEAAEGCYVEIRKKDEITQELIKNFDGAIGQIPPQLLKTSNLKWLQLYFAGTDGYLDCGVLPENCVLTNASGAYGIAISEYMIAVALELLKKLNLYRDLQNRQTWQLLGKVGSFYKSRIAVIGMGDIGKEFALRSKAMGGYIIGFKKRITTKPKYVDELYTTDMLDKILPSVDIVALSLPQTKETINIFDRKRLSLLKKDAIIINVGRGTAIDTEALCDLLSEEKIGGAALDVTNPEPLPKNHRLWNMKNVIITPHCSGKFNLELTSERVSKICEININAFVNNKPMINIVDKNTTYTSKPIVFDEN